MNRRKLLKLGLYGALAAAGGGGLIKIYKHASGAGDIIKYPDPILRATAAPVTDVDAEIVSLSEQLIATVRYHSLTGFFSKAMLGRGLSAPQLGISRRVMVCGILGQIRVLINPHIIKEQGTYTGYESCLSLPNHDRRLVRRPGFIALSYTDLRGYKNRLEAGGDYAALLSHEIDHLNGTLYIDYTS